MVHNGIEYGMMEAFAEGFERAGTGKCAANADNISLKPVHGCAKQSLRDREEA
jgi:6-phosphogluconate dehydrogenase (decarboxylating)